MPAFLYFAYGSNMLTSRLRERCPSAQPIGMATLPGYALKWHKRSKKDGSGKCDVVKDAAATVCGVLFEIDCSEKPVLDRAEGLGNGYEQADFTVLRDTQPITARAYVATDIDDSLKPLKWYRDFVVDGAVEHGLPEAYIAALKAVEIMQGC